MGCTDRISARSCSKQFRARALSYHLSLYITQYLEVLIPAPKPAEVRSQVAAGITDGDVNDLIDLIDSAGADKMFH